MCTGVEIAMIAAAVTSTAVTIDQSNKAEDRAKGQADAAIKAAYKDTEASYAETNRKQAEASLDAMSEKSDAIRKANEALGTLRATESSLSDSSLGTMYFEEGYGNAMSYERLDKQNKRQLAALESEKYGAEQAFLNRQTMASNQAENIIAESNARKTNAVLSLVGSSLQIGANHQARQETLAAIKGSNAGASTTAPKK